MKCQLHATLRPHLCHDCARIAAKMPAPLPVLRITAQDRSALRIVVGTCKLSPTRVECR